ncbi:MAG: conjugal transfer mating-pair stabilization protein TraG [Sodalis sp. (in: enterobacteria)]|uniref:conjugal transfer mating-pair stabilization protein TraG n=1 Tax=Sodalis sp. (in: enterobacteria) TaxID=1898979 RepID=UPI0039E70642
MMELYTIGGGDWLREVLNAVVAFMGTSTFSVLKGIAVLISIYVVAHDWIVNRNIMRMVTWVFVLVMMSLFVVIRHLVQIIDNSNLRTVYQVDNVPVGLLLPAAVSSQFGHGLIAGYEAVFAQPDSVTYSKTGMLFGANLVMKSTDFLSQNPDVTHLFSDYVQNCVIGDILLNHKYSLEQLMNTCDPYGLIFSRPSPLRGIFTRKGVFQTCAEASVDLKRAMALDTQTGGKTWHYYARQLFGGRPDPNALFGALLSGSYQYFYRTGQSASEILKQNVTMNALRDGILSYGARSGDTAGMMNITTMMSLEKQRLAQASSARVATHFMPALHVILMGIMIAIFPVILLCGMVNIATVQILKNYVLSFVWLQCWPVLFAVLNSAMTFFVRRNEVPVVLSNFSIVKENYSDIALAAGILSALIPFISWGMVKGMGQVFSSVSSSLGSNILGSTTQAASSTVDANFTYNNMQTDNMQGFGWNTNSTFASGQMTHQTASGGSATQTMDGNMVYNTTGAMSVLPTQVSVQRSIASAQQQMARESEAEAQTALSGYNDSINAASTQLAQFTHQSGQSDTLTRGADSSLSSNASRAAHQMASAVESYAQANSISKAQATQELMDQANRFSFNRGGSVHAKWDSGDMLPTKLGKWFTGASAGGEAHAGLEWSTGSTNSHNASDSTSSHSDSRADKSTQVVSDFKQGLDVLTSYRTSESGAHTDNNSDSHVNQLAATFSEAKSQYQQYTDSSTRSHEYSEMASRTESLSGQMSENLTQQFANYVSQHSPHNAETLLTDTGSPDVAAQRESLARDFVKQQVMPRIDAEYIDSKENLSGPVFSQGISSRGYDLKNEYSSQKDMVSKNVSDAGIKNNVGDGVNNIISSNGQKIHDDSDSINTQRNIVEGQKENMDAQHKKVSQEQNRRYNEEKKKHE